MAKLSTKEQFVIIGEVEDGLYRILEIDSQERCEQFVDEFSSTIFEEYMSVSICSLADLEQVATHLH